MRYRAIEVHLNRNANPLPSIADLSDCSTPENEYWTHVSPQRDLPLANAAWRERTLSKVDAFVDRYSDDIQAGGFRLRDAVAETLLSDPESLHEFRLVAAVSDKRLYLDLSYTFSRTLDPVEGATTLCGCPPHILTRHSTSFFINSVKVGRRAAATQRLRAESAGRLIASYLIEMGLEQVLSLYSRQDEQGRSAVLEKWLMPRETQQNEAKRRGHGAEAEIAAVLKAVGCRIVPTDKDVNPMGSHDPNISLETFSIVPRAPGRTFSSDITIVDENQELQVAVMGLVQSSDPGQFGVNKSDEIVQLRRSIDEFNVDQGRSLELWGLVDGVGYSENKAGTIDKMLANFHYFVQHNSAYKAPLRAHELGLARVAAISFNSDFYSERTQAQMQDLYVPEDVRTIEPEVNQGLRPIPAGMATVWVA